MHFVQSFSLTLSYFDPSTILQTEHKYPEYPFSQITANGLESFGVSFKPPRQALSLKH